MKNDPSMAHNVYAASRGATGLTPQRGSGQPVHDAPASSPRQPDTVQISMQSRLYALALEAARGAPQTRAELVASLRMQVQNGTYHVNAQRLAGAIARHVDVRA
jgi:flagellar biosynthesis anti-sigma factor FlgM